MASAVYRQTMTTPGSGLRTEDALATLAILCRYRTAAAAVHVPNTQTT